jgi:hypothetical protein
VAPDAARIGDLDVGMRVPVHHLRGSRPRRRVHDLNPAEIERRGGCRVFGYSAFQTGAVGTVDIFGQIAVGRGHRKGPVLAVVGHEFSVDDVGVVGKLPTLRFAESGWLARAACGLINAPKSGDTDAMGWKPIRVSLSKDEMVALWRKGNMNSLRI